MAPCEEDSEHRSNIASMCGSAMCDGPPVATNLVSTSRTLPHPITVRSPTHASGAVELVEEPPENERVRHV
jgi:hypothetical protein